MPEQHEGNGAAVNLRRAIPADAATLAGLARKTFSDTFRDTCTAEDLASFLDEFYTEALFRRDLEDPAVQLWLAEADGIAVGYLQAAPTRLPFPAPGMPALELQRLYIDSAYQGRGVAALLMQRYLDLAAEGGASLLWLGVWEHNLRAQAFYRKWKFAPTGHTHPFPIGNTPQTDEWWSRLL